MSKVLNYFRKKAVFFNLWIFRNHNDTYKSLSALYRKMSGSNSSEVLNHCNIGTIGHVDHGKTTLTSAITKVLADTGKAKFMRYDEIDKAPEEQARGITINVCHVGFSTDKRTYAHTDCPGHKDFIKNMICGTTQMDGAILVISAADGPMPQTYEHLALAKQLGIKNVVVYLNKADLADKEVLELVDLEIRELLDQVGFDSENTPIIAGSALCALKDTNDKLGKESIKQLLDAVDQHIPTPVRDLSGPFYLPVESAFSVTGRGTVAVGTLAQGSIHKNDEAELVGYNEKLKTSVSDLHIFNKSVNVVHAGVNVGVLLRGIKREQVERGMVVAKVGTVPISDHFEAKIYVRTKNEGGRSKPITNNYIQQLFMDTFNIACCVSFDDATVMAMPGDDLNVSVILRKAMPIRVGQRFMIRENYLTTITGQVTKLLSDSTSKLAGFNKAKQITPKIEGNASVVVRKRSKKSKS